MTKKFYAVIHAENPEHGIAQALTALSAGAYGVALINQFCDATEIEIMVAELRKASHRCRTLDSVLVNILGDNERTFAFAQQYHCGAWVDSFDCNDESLAKTIYSGLTVLGGCGFKYRGESDLVTGWKLRFAVMTGHVAGHFVPMISGRATGMAPTERWMDSVCSLIGPDAPLAIASGITEENVGRYLPHASHFLVGTSIETTDHMIVPERVRALADLIGGAG